MSKEDPIKVKADKFQRWFIKQIEKRNDSHLFLNDKQLAEIAGISAPMYSAVKNMKSPMPLTTAVKLADAVGLEIEFKLVEENEEES